MTFKSEEYIAGEIRKRLKGIGRTDADAYKLEGMQEVFEIVLDAPGIDMAEIIGKIKEEGDNYFDSKHGAMIRTDRVIELLEGGAR